MKISIILPAYNCAAYIRQTLDIVRMQSVPMSDIEVILYLDGCTDTTPQIVNEYAKLHPDMNLVILNMQENHGVSTARNIAVKHARGEFIHFLDSDDILNTDFYKNMYDAAINTNADIAVASYTHERWPHDSVIFNHQMVLTHPQDKLNTTLVDQHGYSWRYIIRRSFWINKNCEFPTQMKYCEDMYPMTRCVCLSGILVTVPDAMYFYKYRNTSMLNQVGKNRERNQYYRMAKIAVSAFLTNSNLQRTTRKSTRTWVRLFDILPLFIIRKNTENNRNYVRLFGILPILKTTRRDKNKQWKLI